MELGMLASVFGLLTSNHSNWVMIVSSCSLKDKRQRATHNKAVSFVRVKTSSPAARQRQCGLSQRGSWNDRVKWISASGGCLGDDRLRRTCQPAKSVVALAKKHWYHDVRMGKPTQQCVSQSEYIGLKQRTRRTEPSKYPEAKKSTEIAQVVASERAGACIW